MQFLPNRHQVASINLTPTMKPKPQRLMQRLHRPDMAPFVSLFFMISCFFPLTATLRTPAWGLVRLEETPFVAGGCSNVPDHTQIYICLTSNGRLSFATSDPNTQRASLEETCKKYGVSLSASGMASLSTLPFVAIKLEKLPEIAACAYSLMSQGECPAGDALTADQLLDCVTSSRRLSPQLTGMPAKIYLSIASQTSALLVMQLVLSLQQRSVTQLQLLAHYD